MTLYSSISHSVRAVLTFIPTTVGRALRSVHRRGHGLVTRYRKNVVGTGLLSFKNW
jgi:hypothetical protein